MAGMGTGLGSTNLTGTIATAQANNRAERQQAFKDRQIAIMEEEQAKQKAQYEQSQQQDIVSTVKNQEQQIKKLQKKQAGATSKMAIAGAAVAPAGDNVAFDFVKKVNASPELQEALQVKKGQLNAFDSQARVDDTAFMKYLDKKNIDYTAWTPEYLQQVKDSFSKSGLFYTYQGDLIDGTPLIEATNSLGMVNTNGVNIYEGKKAYLTHMLEGEEALNEAISEAMDDPEKRTWFQDYIDSLPKSEREAIAKRKKELSGKSNKEAQAELEQVAKDTDLIADPVEDPYVSSGTKQQEGNKESYPLEEPIYDEDGNEVAVKMKTRDGSEVVISEKNGEATAVTQDGTAVTKNPDGSGVAIAADGTTTTFDGEKTVTITPDGDIVEDYTLPRHVQMAYDMLGMKSSFSEDAALNRKYVEASIAKANQRNQTFEQYLTEQLKAGNITEESFFGQMKVYENLKNTRADKTSQLLKQAEKMTPLQDGETKDSTSYQQRVADNYAKLVRDSSSGSLRALTFTEEFRTSSKWLRENKDKKGTPEYKEHKTVVDRFANELRTANMKDTAYTAQTLMNAYGMSTRDAFNGEGKVSPVGEIIDSQVRANTRIYTSNIRKREQEAIDTAHSVANLNDILVRIEKGVRDGKYKSGYFDRVVNWANQKAGTSYFTAATAGQIGSDLKEQVGIEGELAIELGRVVKAAYGGNASNADRDTIAGAMAGMTSDDEKTRLLAFENFNRTMRKLNSQNMAYFNALGLFKTTEQLNDAANTVFDVKGNINENKSTAKRSKIRKGTRTQFLNKETGVTFYKANKPYHYTKDGKLVEGVAR